MSNGLYLRKGKRGAGTWYVRYQVHGKDVKEKIGRVDQGVTKETAKQALRSRLGDTIQGKFNLAKISKPIPFSELLRKYDTSYARPNWRGYERNKYFIKSLGDYFGDTPLAVITKWNIEKYKADLRKRFKPSSVNRHVGVLKHMFSKAVEWGLVQVSPATVSKLPEVGRTRFLTEEELDRLVAACQDPSFEKMPWLAPMVVLATHTGLRWAELSDLRWEHVDLDRKLLILNQPKVQKVKSVALNGSAVRALCELRSDHQHVLMTPEGRRLSYSKAQKVFKRARQLAGLEDLHLHDLRHTFGSHLVMSGVDLPTVAALMGHSSIAVTMRYAHLAPKHVAEAVNKLESRLSLDQNRNVEEKKKVGQGRK